MLAPRRKAAKEEEFSIPLRALAAWRELFLSFTHDEDGNLLTDGRWNYFWDGENRLQRVETAAAAYGATPGPGMLRMKIAFTYDDQGRRIARSTCEWNPEAGEGGDWNELGLEGTYFYDGWKSDTYAPTIAGEVPHASLGALLPFILSVTGRPSFAPFHGATKGRLPRLQPLLHNFRRMNLPIPRSRDKHPNPAPAGPASDRFCSLRHPEGYPARSPLTGPALRADHLRAGALRPR